MVDSFSNHHNIEVFSGEKGDIIKYFRDRDEIRRQNQVLKYHLYQLMNKEGVYMAHFQYPSFRIYRKHVESMISAYPEISQDINENVETEYNLKKMKALRYKDGVGELFSIVHLTIESYNYFQERILSLFESHYAEGVVTKDIYTDHVNSGQILIVYQWRTKSDFEKFTTNAVHSLLISDDPQIKNIEFDDPMIRIRAWEADHSAD